MRNARTGAHSRAHRARSARALLAAAIALIAAACAHTAGEVAEEAAEEATDPVVEESLETLSEPGTREELVEILRSEEVQGAARDLVAKATEGALAGVTGDPGAPQVTAAAERLAAQVAEGMEPTLTTVAQRAVDAAAREMLDGALSQAIAEGIAQAVRESTPALAQAFGEGIRLGLTTSLSRDLGPALREALASPETAAALATTMQGASRGVLYGLQEGFSDIEARAERPGEPETILTRLQDLATEGFDILKILLLGLLIVLVGLVIWLFLSPWKGRAEAARPR